MENETAAGALALQDVVITADLDLRPAPPKDPEVEVEALHSLAALLHQGETALLEGLMETALRLCRAGTVGVSLLQRGEDAAELFRWVAVSGRLKDSVGGSTPRDFSPCGTCLDRGRAQLYRYPARYFTYLAPAGIVEGLVVPFRGSEEVVGTIWIVSHDEEVHFDREDLRMMTSLAGFTATALQMKLASTETERKLREAREARRRAEEYVGMLGHELRRPLQQIASGLDEVRQVSEPAAERELAGVTRQVRNLTGLVDGLLDVSRVMRGAVSLRREKVLLETIVGRVCDSLRPSLESRRHRLVLDVERGIIVDVDPARLEQMLGNLLDNAVRYTPAGGVLRLDCEAEAGHARISVSDNGIGIPAESLNHIFEPFVQLSAPDSSRRDAGLGLTLVKRLAELHGGYVRADSQGPGLGATFTIELPCSRFALVATD
jgi:signal transduction histidine kinase